MKLTDKCSAVYGQPRGNNFANYIKELGPRESGLGSQHVHYKGVAAAFINQSDQGYAARQHLMGQWSDIYKESNFPTKD